MQVLGVFVRRSVLDSEGCRCVCTTEMGRMVSVGQCRVQVCLHVRGGYPQAVMSLHVVLHLVAVNKRNTNTGLIATSSIVNVCDSLFLQLVCI